MENFRCHEMSSNVASPKFTHKKEMALILLLDGYKHSEVASKIGVTERTIQRWLKESEFQKRLAQGREDIYKQGMDSLRETFSKAVKKVSELLDSQSEKTSLKAAELIISLNREINEKQDLGSLVGELEKIVGRIAEGGSYEEFEEARRAIRKNFRAS